MEEENDDMLARQEHSPSKEDMDELMAAQDEEDFIDEEEEEFESKGKLTGIEIKPEQVGNTWYAYAADDSQYLGQGPTLEDALKMVADRFPNKKFWCKKPNESSQTT